MNSNKSIYGTRTNGLNHGDVYTSPEIIRFMLDTVGYTPAADLSKVYILEPAFGEGDFLLEIQRRIIASAERYGFNPTETFQKCVFACELDSRKFNIAIERLQILMPDFIPVNFTNADFLSTEWTLKFNFIVGNPPYVRYENIPAGIRSEYKSKFNTFHYRCDLYVLFYEHSLKFLASLGKHCFICSNRWLKNEYGKKLRSLISKYYNLEKLFDIESINAFQESVLAYPAISVISNATNKRNVRFTKINDMQELNGTIKYECRAYDETEDISGIFTNNNHGFLPTIEEQDFSIGIGVATGADRIFISSDMTDKVESELLLPIISAKDLSGNKLEYNGLHIINPYDKYGNLVDLSLYPKAKEYLGKHKEALQNRHIVKKNRPWYSLIDKIKPGLVSEPKILLPDISANTYVFVDNGNYYPSHNIYYITSKTQQKELLSILAAILMSDFVRKQVIEMSNKMNGGFPRWQSQVLRRIRIPDIKGIPYELRKRLIQSYTNYDLDKINNLVNNIIAKTPTKQRVSPNRTSVQLSLFNSID